MIMDPQFAGAVPIGPKPATVITCVWHHDNLPHPPDAPPCYRDERTGERVVSLGHLIAWNAVQATKLIMGFNQMGQNLANLQVQWEALEATIEGSAENEV